MRRESPISRLKMVVGLVLMGQALLFFILYNQMPTSLNFFAINNVRPSLFGVDINPVGVKSDVGYRTQPRSGLALYLAGRARVRSVDAGQIRRGDAGLRCRLPVARVSSAMRRASSRRSGLLRLICCSPSASY